MDKIENDSDVTVEEISKPRKPRGFAAMDREKVRAIASKGGVAAHAIGTAHKFTREEAQAAGRKGGIAPHRVRGRNKIVTVETVETIPASKVA